jgi:RNA polymerase sigma-70 factor, ECF subfamily
LDEANPELMINFHDLYQRYAPDVYRFAFYLSGNAADAEDITADTFVRAWTATDELKLPTVKAYLFTIARNLYLQGRKRRQRHTVIDEALPAQTPDPAELAQTRTELDRVTQALSTLPELDRVVLLMRAQDGLSYEEIAAASGLTVGAAKVKVHRARLKLIRLRTEENPE